MKVMRIKHHPGPVFQCCEDVICIDDLVPVQETLNMVKLEEKIAGTYNCGDENGDIPVFFLKKIIPLSLSPQGVG
jgi:hypothetical protein